MAALIGAVFVASLAGSVHCAGMCGPLVAFVLNPIDRPTTPRALLHLLYHAGRLVAYVALGAAAGGVGAMLDLTGSAVGIQRTAAVLAGLVIVVTGVATLLRHLGVAVPGGRTPAIVARVVQPVQRVAMSLTPLPRATLFGVLTALLPCGWLYAFGATAAGTGQPLVGALVMAAFWAGNVPWLLAVGVSTQMLTRVLGPRMPVVMALVLIALGAFTIASRASIPRGRFSALLGSVAPADAEHAAKLNPAAAPCCHGNGQ